MRAGLLLIAGVIGVAGGARAQESGGQNRPSPPPREQAPPRADARDNNHNSLSDSVRRVQREPGMRVLSAERVPFDGRDINRMKVIDERGRVRYMDDAGNTRRRAPSRSNDEPPPASSQSQPQPPPARSDNPYQP